MDIIQVDQAAKSYNGNLRLGPMDLRVVPGEVLGIMGPNGAGKTTLLRLLWGFLRPDAGAIHIFGMQPHLQQIEIRTKAGYLSENCRFYGELTVQEFLTFISSFYTGWDNDYAEDLLDRFQIKSSTHIGHLSKGTRIKLGLVSALGHHPALLMLDEPVFALDLRDRDDILLFLRKLARQSAVAVLLTSHISDDLDQIADSVLMLKDGQIIEYAQAAHLFAKYSLDRLEAIFFNAIGSQHDS